MVIMCLRLAVTLLLPAKFTCYFVAQVLANPVGKLWGISRAL